jgi:exopolyphosphatase/guanosine-5'-triphosphate,3'-diphosphate pyrophosphatase
MSTDLRLAAGDIGSNALRLDVARVLGEPPWILQHEARYRVPLRLGEDVFTLGLISDEKAALLVEALQAFRHLLNVFQPAKVRLCATAALREAKNGPLIVERIGKETGLKLEIITGAEETRILLASAPFASLNPAGRYLCVDVGGGSTELTLLAQGQVICSDSFCIGGVRLLSNRVASSEWLRLRAWLQALPRDRAPTEAIGAGGNISKLQELAGSKPLGLSRKQLSELLASLEPLSLEERIRQFGLKPDRADVIVPAGRIYAQIMDWAELKTILVPRLGLADGLLAQMYQELLGDLPSPALSAPST